MNDDNNVFTLVPTSEDAGKTLPVNAYVLVDIEDNEFYAEGFLIFTSQHVAIMQDIGEGAIPIKVMQLNRLKIAELVEDEVED